ncbi:MAG: RICIN domain-containing protein [Bacteroidota bacterium]
MRPLTYVLTICMLLAFGCNDDDMPTPPQETGLEVEDDVDIDLEEDPGQVGFTVDARQVQSTTSTEITEIELVFDDPDLSELSVTKEVDPQLIGQTFSWSRADLTEEQLNLLRDGTPIQINVIDEFGVSYAEFTNSTQIVDAAGRLITPTSEFSTLIPDPDNYTDDFEVLIQSTATGRVIQVDGGPADNNRTRLRDYDPSKIIQRFELVKNGDFGGGYFNIRARVNSGPVWLISEPGNISYAASPTQPDFDDSRFLFQIISTPDGTFNIFSVGSGRLIEDNGDRLRNDRNTGTNPESIWRIIAHDLTYTVDDLGSVAGIPILPPAETEFAFKQRIRNCANASTTVSIGVDQSRTTTTTTSIEETLSLFSSSSSTWDISSSLTVGGSFYGASVEATVTAGYSNTTESSVTETTTNTLTEEETETIVVSTARTTTVDPFESIVIYDAAQFYDNVRLHFVQCLRVKAQTPGGRQLSGQELWLQLPPAYFNGTVTEVGSDFVEISLRGVMNLNGWVETETQVTPGEPCS